MAGLVIFTGACAHPDPAKSKALDGRIAIGPQSNVCISVSVDQSIWPISVTRDSMNGLGNILYSRLRVLYAEENKSYLIPRLRPGRNTHYEQRFVVDNDGRSPSCQDTEEDVFIALYYLPLANGQPFSVRYTARKGPVFLSGAAVRFVKDEWRSGALPYLAKMNPLQMAITEDIRSRADTIYSLINR